MRSIVLRQPPKIVFGNGCLSQFVADYLNLPYRNLLLVSAPEILSLLEEHIEKLRKQDIRVTMVDQITEEPTVEMFQQVVQIAREKEVDSVVGIGGGSVMDIAKLVAAIADNNQTIEEVFGIGRLLHRKIFLACLPSTAGTGSEVSPNSILLDNRDNLKKGIISPYLIPDEAYVDPLLTLTVPPRTTATTGIDALIHCIEAYANKYAHPAVDIYALKGISLIGANLIKAVRDGKDREARSNLAMGSTYGGLCLGPVNTAAVHALAYALGSTYKVAHGMSSSVILPYVLKYNLEAAPQRYADIAVALGKRPGKSNTETALQGIEKIEEIMKACQIPNRLSQLNIPKNAIDHLAESAMTVTRLLKNNVREMTIEDAKQIYRDAY
jgi:alcohol dehydrogenase class IV